MAEVTQEVLRSFINNWDPEYMYGDEVKSISYSPGTNFYASYKEFVRTHPNTVRKILANLHNPYYTKEFQHSSRTDHMYVQPFNYDAEYLGFQEDICLFNVDVGNIPDKNYNIAVFVDGVKLKENEVMVRYNKLNGLGSRRVFTPLRNIEKGSSEVLVCIDRVWKQNKYQLAEVIAKSINMSFTFKKEDVSVLASTDVNNYIVAVTNPAGTTYKRLINSVDYVIVDNKDNTFTVTPLVELEIGESILVEDSNQFYKKIISTASNISDSDYLKTDPSLVILDNHSDGKKIPPPIQNPKDLDIFYNGFHLTYNSEYTIDMDYTQDRILVHLKFIPDKGSEIVAISKNTMPEASNINVQQDYLNSQGFINLIGTAAPFSIDYAEAYLDNKRVPPSMIEAIADNIAKISANWSTKNLDLKTTLNDMAQVLEILQIWQDNKSDLTKLVEMMGFDDFIKKYAETYNIPLITEDPQAKRLLYPYGTDPNFSRNAVLGNFITDEDVTQTSFKVI